MTGYRRPSPRDPAFSAESTEPVGRGLHRAFAKVIAAVAMRTHRAIRAGPDKPPFLQDCRRTPLPGLRERCVSHSGPLCGVPSIAQYRRSCTGAHFIEPDACRHAGGTRTLGGAPHCHESTGLQFKSLMVFVPPLVLTDSIPASRDAADSYIWLLPITWPLAAFSVK